MFLTLAVRVKAASVACTGARAGRSSRAILAPNTGNLSRAVPAKASSEPRYAHKSCVCGSTEVIHSIKHFVFVQKQRLSSDIESFYSRMVKFMLRAYTHTVESICTYVTQSISCFGFVKSTSSGFVFQRLHDESFGTISQAHKPFLSFFSPLLSLFSLLFAHSYKKHVLPTVLCKTLAEAHIRRFQAGNLINQTYHWQYSDISFHHDSNSE